MSAASSNPSPGSEFVITRALDAPRDLVFAARTQRENLMRWFGPKGYAMTSCTLDLRPGGIFHYALRMPDGREMWGKWIFREIVKPEKIVVVISFSDAQGGITRHPFNSNWPLHTLATTTVSEREDKTTITMRWAALNATEIEQKTFDESHESMRMGWSGTFAQLEEFLARA